MKTYDIETTAVHVLQRHEPVFINVELWEDDEFREFQNGRILTTTVRRLVQSWELPVTTPTEETA